MDPSAAFLVLYLSRLFERYAFGLRGRGAITRRGLNGPKSAAMAAFAAAPKWSEIPQRTSYGED